MTETLPVDLIRRRFEEAHGARLEPAFGQFMHLSHDGVPHAALGYRRAGDAPLYLERYLDVPIEVCLAPLFGAPVRRESVIEIGNLAADDAFAMVVLWAVAANDLGASCEIAVATLTRTLRRMFERMGVRLHRIAKAGIERSDDPDAWGQYYGCDPVVCAGSISQGQRAIASFMGRRRSLVA